MSAEIDALGRPTPRLFFIDEYRHDLKTAQMKLTDAQLARENVAWMGCDHLPANTTARLTPRFTILDPSAASLSVEMRNAHGITTHPADNDVLYGLHLFASLLVEGKLLVTDRCKGLIQEMPGYSWELDATANGEDKPIKIADHSIDGAR